MALRVNNNVAALNAYRNLTVSEGQQSKSLEKLSSGFRINRAADDAAGLSISEGLRSQVGGLKVASRNAQDGVSVVQTAEGALTEVHSMLQRMRDLAVQASNTGANGGARSESVKAANAEVTQLKDAITQIATTTQFNGKQLLDGADLPADLPGRCERGRDPRGQPQERAGRRARDDATPTAPWRPTRPISNINFTGLDASRRARGRRRRQRVNASDSIKVIDDAIKTVSSLPR